jgi:hypothetical protein
VMGQNGHSMRRNAPLVSLRPEVWTPMGPPTTPLSFAEWPDAFGN